MADTLTTILADVATIYTAVSHTFGAANFEKLGVPPRIVWVLGEVDEFVPNRGQGRNPRPLWTVRTPIDVHIWGSTWEQVETMRNSELAAIHRVLYGSYGIISGRRVQYKELLSRGIGYVLTFAIDQPITDEVSPTATVEEFTHQGTMQFPAGDVDDACSEEEEPGD